MRSKLKSEIKKAKGKKDSQQVGDMMRPSSVTAMSLSEGPNGARSLHDAHDVLVVLKVVQK